MPEPREDSDAANKKYVDDVAKSLTVEEALVKENGGYNIIDKAYIKMNFGNIRNIGEPSLISDAATKGYVDETVTKEIKKGIEKETHHMIAAHASYHGDLIRDDYQFTFGGSSVESYKKHDKYNGFVIPHSGYIKRFVVKNTCLKFPSENIISDSVKLVLNFCDDDEQYVITNPEIIPLFSLNIIKNDGGEIVELGVLYIRVSMRCEKLGSVDVNSGIKDTRKAIVNNIYSFVSSLPEGIEKYHLSPKDILNIKTELSTEKLNNPYLIVDDAHFLFDVKGDSITPLEFSNYPFLYLNPATEFFTYLATILIELDPL